MKLQPFTRGTFIALGLLLSTCGLASAGLSECQKNIAIQQTNLFQLDSIQFDYDHCEKDDTGNGYSAGIANFCTGIGDLWEVIKVYHIATNGNDEFTIFDETLQKYANELNGTTADLKDFCKVWNEAAAVQEFMDAQDEILDRLYFKPSQEYSDKLGLNLSISQAQLYDTSISHGTSSSSHSLGGMIELTNSRIGRNIVGNSTSTLQIGEFMVDEIEWLKEFLNVRAGYSSEGDATNSIQSYLYMLQNGDYAWGDSVYTLDNENKRIQLLCTNSYTPNSSSELDSVAPLLPLSSSSLPAAITQSEADGLDGLDTQYLPLQ